MNTQVMINLPNETYYQVEHLAQLTRRNIADILTETIELALPPLKFRTEVEPPVSTLSDTAVMALLQLQMNPEQDKRLSLLLHHQQANKLTRPKYYELLVLMQIYQEGLLRKAQALHEAVRRGLCPPLEP